MRDKKELNADRGPHDRECDKPEIRDSFKTGCCSEEQIIKCHGEECLNRLKSNEGK